MNTKIMIVASIIFAMSFVAVFLAVYSSGSSLVGSAFGEYFQNQNGGQMIDILSMDGEYVASYVPTRVKNYIKINQVYDPSLADITIETGNKTGNGYLVTITREGNKIAKIKFGT